MNTLTVILLAASIYFLAFGGAHIGVRLLAALVMLLIVRFAP